MQKRLRPLFALCYTTPMRLPLKISTDFVIIGAGFFLIVALFVYLAISGMLPLNFLNSQDARLVFEASLDADLKALEKVEPNFASIRAFFVEIADTKGGLYAFEVLKRAELPPNTDLHLMGHAIGDELYKQEGLEGMQFCTHDFRNACSHSVVVGALLAEGLSVLDRVNDVCKKAPGGPGAYTMCFHGFGHGVLAFTEYEVPQAVELCGRIGTQAYSYQEAYQCIGGMVMEMHQGVHDPEIWEQKKDKYLTVDKPLRMCQEDYMPDGAKVLCYSYITPFIFDAAGARNGNPTPDIYTKSFSFCDDVESDRDRESCYAGLGKEFIVLAQDRDIRRMEDTPNDRLELAISWCMLAEKTEAQEACLIEILDSLYWGGENDPEVSVRYCGLLSAQEVKDMCFAHLFRITTFYQPNPQIRETICSSVPAAYTQQCREIIL
jgi:hypothetical protein